MNNLQSNITFIYKGKNINIPTLEDEMISSAMKKFANKMGHSVESFIFLFFGSTLLPNETKKIKDFKQCRYAQDQMKILVYYYGDSVKPILNPSKKIICTKCHSPAILDISNYKITINSCEQGHIIKNITFKEFEESQLIEKSNVINTENICSIHNFKYMFYCLDCNNNLCSTCRTNHEMNHNIISLNELIPSLSEYIMDMSQKLNEKKEKINSFIKETKNYLLKIIDNIEYNLNFFIKINNKIISDYDPEYPDFESIQNLINMKNNLEKNFIMQDIDKFLQEKNFEKKYNMILEISNHLYNKSSEVKLIYNNSNKIENKIRLFGSNFVKNNYKNCTLLINNRDSNLCEFYEQKESEKNKSIEVLLIENKTITNMSNMFDDCEDLISINGLENWDTSKVSEMNYIFKKCTSLSVIPDISNWNLSKVDNIVGMFYQCQSIHSLPDLSRWDISNVKNSSLMFYKCSSLTSLPDISTWDTSNIKTMIGMFKFCSSLTKLPEIKKWNVSQVEDMRGIFDNCNEIKKTDIPAKFRAF